MFKIVKITMYTLTTAVLLLLSSYKESKNEELILDYSSLELSIKERISISILADLENTLNDDPQTEIYLKGLLNKNHGGLIENNTNSTAHQTLGH